jgi:5-methylcytosine-specific restriction endonuclease McrA
MPQAGEVARHAYAEAIASGMTRDTGAAAAYQAAYGKAAREIGDADYRAIHRNAGARRRMLSEDTAIYFPIPGDMIDGRAAVLNGRCWMCGDQPDEISMDHVKPLVRGGSNIPANLRPSCRSCNSRKHATWPVDVSTSAARFDPARLP